MESEGRPEDRKVLALPLSPTDPGTLGSALPAARAVTRLVPCYGGWSSLTIRTGLPFRGDVLRGEDREYGRSRDEGTRKKEGRAIIQVSSRHANLSR